MNQFGPPSPTKEEHKVDPTAIVMKPKKAKLYFNKDGTYRPPPKVPSITILAPCWKLYHCISCMRIPNLTPSPSPYLCARAHTHTHTPHTCPLFS